MGYGPAMHRYASSYRVSLGACSLALALAGCSTAASGTGTDALTDGNGTLQETTSGQPGQTEPQPTTTAPNPSSTASDGTTEASTFDPTGDETMGVVSETGTTTDDPMTTDDPSTTEGPSTTDDSSTTDDPSMGTGDMTTGQEGDVDGDLVPDEDDNCPNKPNPMQEDTDSDGAGDACDDDDDDDTIPDEQDNCPLTPNQDQADLDTDGQGDACDGDLDGDQIPNGDDPFPEDGGLPGKVVSYKIYAHTSSTLYTVDVAEPYTEAMVGAFKFSQDGCNHQMTDVAIDRYGVLYGVSFDCGYVIHPQTAQAIRLGSLPTSFNGLTLVPKGILDPNKDVLVGTANNGDWYRLALMNGVFMAQKIGQYGAGYTSAGDAFSIENVGTFGAVNKTGVSGTVIVEVDPATGAVQKELATLAGFSAIYGLAGWQGLILAFSSGGEVFRIHPTSGEVTNLGDKNISWWGAGVGTVIPQ